VIVDRLSVEETAAGLERAARIRWTDGEFRLAVTIPPELGRMATDGSPFLCALLLPAMRLGEDLEIDGPVSPRLARSSAAIRDTYLDWCPDLHPSRVECAEELEPPLRANRVGCFFSRGVDSTFSVGYPRPEGPLTQLLFVDRLEPNHDEAVREEEIRRARLVAERVGLPLAVLDTNLRSFTDDLIRDWEDMAGAGLSFVANSVPGGLGQVVIPSTDGPLVGPCGTSPLLDPLFSTEAVEITHDRVSKSRVAKVFWLARERPELLTRLKTCWVENRPDNCGRCSKCLVTMVSLEAAGALELAEDFPPIDLDAVAALDKPLREWTWWAEGAEALNPERHAALRELVFSGLRGAGWGPPGAPPVDTPGFRRRSGAQWRRFMSRTTPAEPKSGENAARKTARLLFGSRFG
jgi:7-cyano-7-deazaguanine synthase in queuosine biosynthesis